MTDFPPTDDHEPGVDPPAIEPIEPIDPIDQTAETAHDLATDETPTGDTVGDPADTAQTDWSAIEEHDASVVESAAEEAAETGPTEPVEVSPDAVDPAFSEEDLIAAASSDHAFEPATEEPTTEPTAGAADPSSTPPPGAQAGDPGGPSMPPPPTPGAAPPPYGVPAPSRRLYRSRHDRRIGGVSAGVAEYLNVDPTIVRLVTLLFAFSGVGLLIYLAAWLIVPVRPEGLVEPAPATPIANERTLTLAFGIAALALAFGIVTDSWEVLAIALIGGGIWLLSERTALSPGVATPVPGTASSYAAPAPHSYEPAPYSQVPPQPVTSYPPLGGSPVPPPYVEPAPVRERKPQRITWLVLSLLALLAAVGIAASSGNWWDVSATRLLGIGVVIIGVGVVVGQLRGGGARGLIPLGVIAALLLLPVSAVDGLLDEGVGEANYRPSTIAELQDSYEHGIGKLTVDLSRIDFEGRSETIDIDLGIGELIVIVSDEAGGEAALEATAGEVSHFLPGTKSFLYEEGVNVETGTVSLEGDTGTLDLNISVGFGTAELRSDDR